ncbi:BTB/POZ domain-containing protein [Capsicum baccatum]|uniref:BTB/POZ domain-containing protein n=1 Tax=Capsicum baccatum TaxID=33114 RepID=A0A2G2WTV2_CAPBA|nr:BTB/POZ domain-containing protein [Capsicum baccatum]
MLDENWNPHSDSAFAERFIDRNPDCFGVLLDLLRTGELYIHPKIHKWLVYKEAECFGILDHVISAECDTFDDNRPRLAKSITGWSVMDGEISRAIHANPSGWCCVAHGSMAHVPIQCFHRKRYRLGALGFRPDNKLFSSCTKSTSDQHRIGVWDQVTGKQIDFLNWDTIQASEQCCQAAMATW